MRREESGDKDDEGENGVNLINLRVDILVYNILV